MPGLARATRVGRRVQQPQVVGVRLGAGPRPLHRGHQGVACAWRDEVASSPLCAVPCPFHSGQQALALLAGRARGLTCLGPHAAARAPMQQDVALRVAARKRRLSLA